jgi:signal transduction histidine kinase
MTVASSLPPVIGPPPRPWPQRVVLHLGAALALCSTVAGFLTLVFDDPFGRTLVYSLCIGGIIQALIEAGRYTVSAWRIRRGHRHPQLWHGWPGWPFMAPWVLFSAFTGHALGHRLGAWLTGLPPQPLLAASGRSLVLVLVITFSVSLVATYHFYVRGRLAGATAQAEAARRLASENQLRLLQSQLEPHMLFNTLANLRVLIGLDTERAQAMLDRLISFLRATLQASRSDWHPLSAEFDRLADYLALMAVRMGPRLQVTLSLPEELRDRPVPPLLLQPLVENCIRHGLEPQVAGGRITVRAELADGQLLLTVRDTGAGLPTAPRPSTPADGPQGGFGTHQVRERLRALYGDRAHFDLLPAGDADGGTLARITLPDAPD